jgi:hypothetical protein
MSCIVWSNYVSLSVPATGPPYTPPYGFQLNTPGNCGYIAVIPGLFALSNTAYNSNLGIRLYKQTLGTANWTPSAAVGLVPDLTMIASFPVEALPWNSNGIIYVEFYNAGSGAQPFTNGSFLECMIIGYNK